MRVCMCVCALYVCVCVHYMYVCVCIICMCVCALYVAMSTLSISYDYLYTLKTQGVCVCGGGEHKYTHKREENIGAATNLYFDIVCSSDRMEFKIYSGV